MSDCPECKTLEQILMEVRIELQDSEGERKRLLRRTKRLEQELSPRKASQTEELKVAEEMFNLWLAPRAVRPGRAPAFTDDRLKALLWGLKHYQRDGAEAAIRASFKYPFLVYGKWATKSTDSKDRKDDLTDIFGVAKRTEALIALHDGGDVIPEPTTETAFEGAPVAHRLHGPMQGWTPIVRATTALKREAGWDTCQTEWAEKTLYDRHPKVVRYHSWCPLHPSFVGLRLWEGDDKRVRAECDGACAEQAIVRAVFELEERQVQRVKALQAFDNVANPQTLDKVVKALEIREGDSRYQVARKMGIHDDEALLRWAA